MSNKLVKKTPEQLQKEENERYMAGKPSRLEVANYVNAMLEKNYLPLIATLENHLKLSTMVLQGVLIDKGVCTGEEIKEITEEFQKRQQEEIQKQMKQSEEQKDNK